jgi:hypothetical protein
VLSGKLLTLLTPVFKTKERPQNRNLALCHKMVEKENILNLRKKEGKKIGTRISAI